MAAWRSATLYPLQEGLDERALLSLAASAEAKSEHPLGKSIVACAKEQALPITESTDFQMVAGKGIRAQVARRNLLCGHEKYLTENGVVIGSAILAKLEHLRTQGKSIRPVG